jgi:hypothetical protein
MLKATAAHFCVSKDWVGLFAAMGLCQFFKVGFSILVIE